MSVNKLNYPQPSSGQLAWSRIECYLDDQYHPLLLEYLDKLGKKSILVRCGFALDFFRERWEVDETVIKNLKKQAKSGPVYYLDRGIPKGTGKLIKEWNLIIPVAFEELVGGVGSLPS